MKQLSEKIEKALKKENVGLMLSLIIEFILLDLLENVEFWKEFEKEVKLGGLLQFILDIRSFKERSAKYVSTEANTSLDEILGRALISYSDKFKIKPKDAIKDSSFFDKNLSNLTNIL